MDIPFEKLKGRWVSIVIDGPDERESYVGRLVDVKPTVICLDFSERYDNPNIEKIWVRREIILSVWLYKEKKE